MIDNFSIAHLVTQKRTMTKLSTTCALNIDAFLQITSLCLFLSVSVCLSLSLSLFLYLSVCLCLSLCLQTNKTLNLQYHGIFCIIWRHIKVFAKYFHGKWVCPVIWWATGKVKPARFLKTVILCKTFRGNF